MANADDFIKIIDAAVNIMYKERKYGSIVEGSITCGFAELKIPQNAVIIGDIHGDLNSLFDILNDIEYEKFLASARNKMIFMGDYVDRGSQSIGVLYTICYLKQKYPHSIVLMRGNHEAPIEFPFSSHDLPLEILKIPLVLQSKIFMMDGWRKFYGMIRDRTSRIIKNGSPLGEVLEDTLELI